MSSVGLAQRAGDHNAGRDFYGPAGSCGAGLRREGTQSNSRFVPFADSSQFIFKDSGEQVVEPVREKVPARHT